MLDHIGAVVKDLVVSPTSESGQIHLNPAAITMHFNEQSVSSMLKLTFLPEPAPSMSSPASLSSTHHQTQSLTPSPRRDRPLSSTHDHTKEHCLP